MANKQTNINNKSQHNLDILKKDGNKCFGNDENQTNINIEDCNAFNRLVCALKYHSSLNNEQFNELCIKHYQNTLDDYIHFMTQHSNQIEQINKILPQNNNVNKCTSSKCNIFNRHYRRRDLMSNDEIYWFYSDLFDRFHHFIYHLFDIGIRISKNEIKNINEQKTESNSKYIDYVFEKQQKIIKNKKSKYKINRFNVNNNKYILNVQNNNNNTNINEETMIDLLVKQVKNKFGSENAYSVSKFLM